MISTKTVYRSQKSKSLLQLIVVVVLLAFSPGLLFAEDSHPILVISSYNPDTKNTTSNITEFQEEYKLLGGTAPMIIENMNCKSLPEAPEWKGKLKLILEKYAGNKHPALIIILGQEAWSSYISQDSLPFENVPILCGMASQNAVYLPDSTENLAEWEPEYVDIHTYRSEGYNISGYLLSYDVQKNVDLIRSLYPNTKHIALLTDNTYGGVALQTYVKREMKHITDVDLILLDGRKNTLYTLTDQIRELPEKTAILIGTWRVDRNDGYFVANGTYALMMANPSLPAFTITSSGLGHWAIGGYVPQYRSLGKDLAKQADAIIKKEINSKNLRVEMIPNYYTFDVKKLKEFGIEQQILPRDSVFINDESMFNKYRYEILVSIIVTLLAFLIMILVFFLRTKKLKDSLLDLQEDNVLIMNNMQSAIKYIKPDFTVKWENQLQYPCIPQYGPDNCFLSKEPKLPYCDKCSVIKAMETKQPVDVTKDCDAWGRYIHVLVMPVLDEKENLLGVVFKKDDVTKQKKSENELRVAKEKAEQSDKLKSAFLANMSHEIRTPLNAIVGFSSLLSVTDDPEDKLEYVNIINNNNDLLLQLINDILDLSKIEAGTLDFVDSDVDVNSLFYDIEQSSRLKVPNSDVKLSFKDKMPNLILHTDKNRLAQVITNFINNAVKFTEKGSITFGYKPTDDDRLFFYVKDTGCGMSEEGAKGVFQRFVKLNSFVQGTGLGLSICETIVKKMEGEIGVDSKLGEGSTFWFKIPNSMIVSQITSQEGGVVMEEPEEVFMDIDKSKVNIIVAEENSSYFVQIQSMLREFNLMHAASGDEAIAMYFAYQPSLILMNLDMMDMNGYEATEEIRKTDQQIPIIAIASPEDDSREQTLEKGFTDFLMKPLKAELLRKMVDTYLRVNVS